MQAIEDSINNNVIHQLRTLDNNIKELSFQEVALEKQIKSYKSTIETL